jgi:uncharacterized OB-fold protein
MPTTAPESAAVGMRVRATFKPASDEVAFVEFVPDA